MEISKKVMIDLYSKMMLSRRFEEKVVELYRAGLKGAYHMSIGQEAVAAGVCTALNADDYVLSTHRGLGHFIAKGGNLKALMAEFMEKEAGCNKGKGGSMHMVDPRVGMLGATGIVGSSIPIACGAALSAKLRGSRQVAVSFFGDGAANNGPCHESMNLAGVWKLPVVFVCENNLYQARVPSSRCASIQDLYLRAASYGFPGYKVDGMDVVAVYEGTREAVNRARNGGGPTLLECKTYYFRGHSEAESNPGLAYRSAEELKSWEGKCPLRQARTVLLQKGWGTEAELKEIDDRCRQAVEEAVSFAVSSPKAPAEWALLDVYHSEVG